MKRTTLLLALLLIVSSCASYRTENYKIRGGQTPAEAYKKAFNNDKWPEYLKLK